MAEHTRMNRATANVAKQAYEHAIRLGHPYLGTEHFLLALAATGQTAGEVLRARGVTPGRPAWPWRRGEPGESPA